MKTIAFGMIAAVSALAAGCASAPLPAERMASSQGSIKAAEAAGARNEPTAALHLRLAQENYEKATKMAKDGDTERAKLVLQRAEADAELALVLARESQERTEAQRMLEQMRAGGMPTTPTPTNSTPMPATQPAP